jgi:hypothetical protein
MMSCPVTIGSKQPDENPFQMPIRTIPVVRQYVLQRGKPVITG